MRLSVFGIGHVGLVTSVCFAELGHTVTAVDKDRAIVAKLAGGIPTLYEPGLEGLLQSNLRAGRLTFTTSAEDGLESSQMIFLCVGTPARSDGGADLSQVEEVIGDIAPRLNGYRLIVEKSTVPVNTAHRIDRAIRLAAGPGGQYDVASNPEFLREGSAIQDFLHPDRIVIGADSERARELLLGLYRGAFDCPILVASVKQAELIKHAANAFLATKISFMNMVSDLCDRVGVDVALVAKGIGLDRRIGPHFLQAGLGFGGSCFGKDLKAFSSIAEEHGVDFSLLREVGRINEARIGQLLRKLEQAVPVMQGKTVGVLGVAYKAGTDDIREAPSLRVIPRLVESGAALRVYDPRAASRIVSLYPPHDRLAYVDSSYEAARRAHALLILTDWDDFRSVDLGRVRSLMRMPLIVDGRNLFEPDKMRDAGFEYHSLGRGNVLLAHAVGRA